MSYGPNNSNKQQGFDVTRGNPNSQPYSPAYNSPQQQSSAGYQPNDIYASGHQQDPYSQKPVNGYGANQFNANVNIGGNAGYNPYGQRNQQNEPLASDDFAHDGGDLGQKQLSGNYARAGFIRKVYSILSTQLLCTAGVVMAVFLSDGFRLWLHNNPWVLIVSIVLNLVSMYALGCYRSLARSVPINYILLAIFTVTESFLVASISSQYDASTVMIAACLTAAAVVGLTIYAFYTDSDLTVCLGLMFVLTIVMIVASILAIFIRNRWFQLAISICGVLLFSVYLIIDTQLILGNKSNALSIDDYVWAAMNLYIDIVQLFLYILQILGSKN